MSDVAVVILNYNGRDFLERFLPTVCAHSGEAKIIVADNASSDNSIEFLKANFPQVGLIELDKNFGFAGGYNEALKQVDAKFYAIINSDIEVTANWLNPLVSFLEKNEEYVSVQPKIKDWNKKEFFEYAGACGGFVDALGYPYCRGRIFNTIEKDEGQYDDQIDVDWTSGACMLIRSSAFHEVGGFDASFFAHMEEIDLCWRLRSAGHKLACIPESTVYHVGGGTLSKSSPFKTYLNFRNGLLLLVKNLPFFQILWKIPIRLMLDGVAAIKICIENSPRHLVAVIKAHFHFYWRFSSAWKARQQPTATRNNYILSSYFIRKKRKYAELD